MDTELLQAIAQIVKTEVQPIKDDLGTVKTDLETVKTEVLKTSLTIENEIRTNIKLLAEGHMGLVERLDRLESKVNEIDDIKDSVSVLKFLTLKDR